MNRHTVLADRITRRAAVWLADAQRIQILHIFGSSINVVNEDKGVISLTAPDVIQTPLSITISDRESFEMVHGYILKSDKHYIHSSGEALTVGPVHIEVGSAEFWDASIDWPLLRTLLLEDGRTNDIKRQLALLAPEGSIIRALDVRAKGSAPAPMLSNIRELLRRLYDQDWLAAGQHARAICGLGIGLTPAGDDFLMGVIYALHTLYGTDDKRAVRAIFESCQGRTTTLSTAWLETAAGGEASEPWHRLLRALHANDRAALDDAVTVICQTGHSSGADALTGFMLSIEAMAGISEYLLDIKDEFSARN